MFDQQIELSVTMKFCAMCSFPDRPFLLRNSPSLTQSGHVLKSRFLRSHRSLQGACLTSPVAAGTATLAVVTASTSQQVTQMAPGQVISVLRNFFHISKIERDDSDVATSVNFFELV
jgi:hypothetical protein